ncbi:MAG: tRNA (pseudouridine(54)-N(1))-methyltransferase TrmY [Legionellales bacterium]|nr:tRNA (pseudouridine(54)-N(1))-methyltransferase TrmY [Legionellales bacterium]
MRTFVLRARDGTTRPERVKSQIGSKGHLEVVAHTIINAFFLSSGFREDVEVYIVLESTPDFPRTLKFSSSEGLSFAGFHEQAIFDVIEHALRTGHSMYKDETRSVSSGLQISAFGFERLVQSMLSNRPLYLLDKKGEDIRTATIGADPVFLLSDHLVMPKKSVKGFMRHGLTPLSFGSTMLFASQCVVIAHYELDRRV